MKKQRKSVGMQTIADHVGVSLATVSMALADHPNVAARTKSRILRACKDLDYVSPRGRIGGPDATVKRLGLALMGERLTDEMASVLINWVVRAGDERSISVQVSALEKTDDPMAVLAFLRRQAREVDAIMVSGTAQETHLEALVQEDCRVVLYGNVLGVSPMAGAGRLPCHQLFYDDLRSARYATTWLLERGHRVGFVCEQVPPGLTHDQNLEGYQLAHLKAGLALPAGYVQIAGVDGVGGAPAAAAYLAMAEPPTAFLIPQARTAFSFLAAMREGGVPVEQQAVVLSCDESRRQTYMLEDCPCYCPDIPTTAETLFGLLRGGMGSSPMAVRLPHVFHNFG